MAVFVATFGLMKLARKLNTATIGVSYNIQQRTCKSEVNVSASCIDIILCSYSFLYIRHSTV